MACDHRLGIPDCHRTVLREGPVEHGGEVVLVSGGQHRQIGKQAEITQIEGAVVRGTVGAGQAGPVDHEHHRQVLQADLLEDLVE